jgi:hypothetical protein
MLCCETFVGHCLSPFRALLALAAELTYQCVPKNTPPMLLKQSNADGTVVRLNDLSLAREECIDRRHAKTNHQEQA